MRQRTSRIRWSGERNARLGFLIGLGWTAPQIAADHIVCTTERSVRTHADRLGLRFRDAPIALYGPDVETLFDREAHRYAMTGRQLVATLFKVLAEEPSLIHSVVDIGG